jgi:1,4-alpha-glucan branching enzyme
VHTLVTDMNRIYRDTSALWSLDTEGSGFSWIDANDSGNNTFSFLRFPKDPADGPLACVANFSAVPHHHYQLGLPHGGAWSEVLNTDAGVYAGSGVGNLGAVQADQGEHHGQPSSAMITVPPLATLWLRPS